MMRNLMRLISVAILVAGCTPSSENGGLERIQLLLDWKAQMEHGGFFVAIHEGYYGEAGLDVEILEGNGAPTTAQLVGNGTYKFGVSSGSATVIARAKGIPVISLAVINQRSPVVVYSMAATGIESPNDLVGKRIGVNVGGTKHREFRAFLKHVGLAESQMEIMGMTESSPAPLLAGQVDAMLGYTEDQPVSVELRGEHVNRILLADHGIDLYSTNIIANEAYASAEADLVARFLSASLKGWERAIASPGLAVEAYTAARPESDEAFNRANFAHLLPILQSEDVDRMGVGAQTAERWSATQNLLLDLGLIERSTPLENIFTNRFLSP